MFVITGRKGYCDCSIGMRKYVLTAILLLGSFLSPSRCHHIPAVYNFGDSNSDTGCDSSAFGRVPSPNGRTFFAEQLGFPFLSAYLDSLDSNFTHGVNFAASGSTAQPADGKLFEAGFNPLSLNIQVLQFEQLKERTEELYDQDRSSWIKRNLPRPKDFSQALYTLDCGQNDLHYALISMTMEKIQAYIPNVINQLALAIEKLYIEGARAFWIHNTGPIGCLPNILISYPPKFGHVDQNGCVQSYNEVAQEFNKQLKDKVSKLRNQLHDALLIFVDVYSAKYDLISTATEHGFVNPLGYCCGHLEDYLVGCGKTVIVNGTEVFGASCSDPSKYISWDGIHYTDAANKWVANRILDGSHSDPPIPITEASQKPNPDQ
ncbi:GDSL esterase/lipase [Quillaja saponaria]|uniref:GDSL esterase/lipase n=1 Tax=Quillaja saponaria TaxID=32244 RepID=A0AAD7KSX8_QUISA|nr:GDSL esterase/lipase [Quillaja saponaria]